MSKAMIIYTGSKAGNKSKKIINEYQDKGHCQKVTLVSHSMGRLIAHYHTEIPDGRNKIYGIVHGVMPATGAAAAYTRMKRGAENTENNLSGYIATHIPGRDAAEMTTVCSQSPGSLTLLPFADYSDGCQNRLRCLWNKCWLRKIKTTTGTDIAG